MIYFIDPAAAGGRQPDQQNKSRKEKTKFLMMQEVHYDLAFGTS